MKRTFKVLGIIALLAIIGFSMAACSSGDSDPEKTIIITGIPAEYLTATRYNVFVVGADNKSVALGGGQLSGNTITSDLYIVKYNPDGSFGSTPDRWTGKGTFRVGLTLYMGENNRYGSVQSISITDAVTTIPASQFQIH